MLIKQNDLTIRNATIADVAQLGIWWRDGNVMAHTGFPKGLQITDEKIAKDLEHDSDDTYRRLIIELNFIPIGEMSYHTKGDNTAEIGIKICDFSAQEKGRGTQLLRMLVDVLFRDYGYNKIILDTNLKNKRAQHVYEKIGFRKIGIRYNSWKDQLGEPQSAVDYELYETDFRKTL
jgi:RimJ/RimL family protein N-acetyltransferase